MADVPACAQAQKHFHNLAVLAYLDGRVEENELRFLQQKQRALGLTDAEGRDILQRVAAGRRDMADPGSAAEREALLSDAAEMALAEGFLHQAVFDKLCELARKMGSTDADMERVVQRLLDRYTVVHEVGKRRVSRRLVHAAVIGFVVVAIVVFDRLFYGLHF